MCTVSYIPRGRNTCIVHSRDEQSSRLMACKPAEYLIRDHILLFPQDANAGGTWMACNKNGQCAFLLNGAFKKHHHDPPYRQSRGLVLLDITASDDCVLAFNAIDLRGIEPFTIGCTGNNRLYQCCWDGHRKYVQELAAAIPHVWSSVTLYDIPVRYKRNKWFKHWLRVNPRPSLDEIIQFHLTGGDGDPENDLRMNRQDKLLTVSITGLEIQPGKSIMKYLDLQNDTVAIDMIHFTKAAAPLQ